MVKEIFNEDGSHKKSMTLVPEIKALQDDLQHSKATTNNNYNKNNLNSAEEFENTIEILSTETLADNIFNNVDIIKYKQYKLSLMYRLIFAIYDFYLFFGFWEVFVPICSNRALHILSAFGLSISHPLRFSLCLRYIKISTIQATL